jgi:prepilin-type N-terminal cleavage/methylation domain-containing protein
MILHRLKLINKNQRAFTLVEIIVALAITGLIGVGAATATVQTLTQSTRNTDYTTASRQVLNTIHWLSRDAQMAQTIEPDGASGFPLTLTWVEWDNSTHQIIYTLEDSTIKRSYSVDGGAPTEMVVAQNINTETSMTNCEFADWVLTVKVTATLGQGANAVSVTKVREIVPRPGL